MGMMDWVLAKMKLSEEKIEEIDFEVEEETVLNFYENIRLPHKKKFCFGTDTLLNST